MSRLSHPHIVQVRSWSDAAGGFFVMEYLEGPDFVTWVRSDLTTQVASGPRANLPMAFGQDLQEEGVSAFQRCTPTGLARLRHGIYELAAAVSAIHDAGMVHLDITPENTRVVTPGRLVLLDLGLAAEFDENGQVPAAVVSYVGSAPYMAPEHGALPPTRASDWYSVGVVLFQALTGALPFEGAGPDLLAKKRSVSAPEPSSLVSDVPADLCEACRRWLTRSPLDRGGREVARELGGDSIVAFSL
jgi:serine/threonine protein kinase